MKVLKVHKNTFKHTVQLAENNFTRKTLHQAHSHPLHPVPQTFELFLSVPILTMPSSMSTCPDHGTLLNSKGFIFCFSLLYFYHTNIYFYKAVKINF